MGRRLLVSRKIGVSAAAAASLAGHAGIAHNHDGLGVAVSQSDKAKEGRGQKRKRESDDRECKRSPSTPAMIVTVTRHVDAWRHALATPQLLVRASLHGLRPVPSLKRCCSAPPYRVCTRSRLCDIKTRCLHADI